MIEKVTEGFNTLNELVSEYPNLKSLLSLAESGKIDFKHLMFVNMMLPFFNKEGFMFLEEHFNDFIETIKHHSVKSDCTWQKIVKATDFQPECAKIEKFIHSRECTLNEEQRKEIQTYMLMNECQFDLKTVKAYQESGDKQHFSAYLKTDRQRVESYYVERFNARID